MNSHSLQNIRRFGAIVVVALVGRVLLTESAKSSRISYSIVSKPRPGLRQFPNFSPPALSTAIGFGKRGSSFRSPNLDRHNSITSSPHKNVPHGFPVSWFLQYLRSNPELANEVARQLFSENDNNDDDDDNVGSSATHRYKKDSDSDDSYYLNK